MFSGSLNIGRRAGGKEVFFLLPPSRQNQQISDGKEIRHHVLNELQEQDL
jgi:hypothetical protein